MPQFIFDQQADGRLNAVYKDGVKITQAVHLEMPQAIVQTYFKAALRNLRVMKPGLEREVLRLYGLQAFLMSLVGLEAFLSVHFHMVGIEKDLPKVIDLATKRNANVETKI